MDSEEELEAEAERLYNERFRAPFGTQPWDQVGFRWKRYRSCYRYRCYRPAVPPASRLTCYFVVGRAGLEPATEGL